MGFFPHIFKWGKNPAVFFQKKVYQKLSALYCASSGKRKFPRRGFPLPGFPPQNKMGEKPCGFFYPKIIFSVFSSKKHFTLCVQSCESFISKQRFQFLPWWEILKYTLPKWQCIIVRLMAENVLLPAKELCGHIVS